MLCGIIWLWKSSSGRITPVIYRGTQRLQNDVGWHSEVMAIKGRIGIFRGKHDSSAVMPVLVRVRSIRFLSAECRWKTAASTGFPGYPDVRWWHALTDAGIGYCVKSGFPRKILALPGHRSERHPLGVQHPFSVLVFPEAYFPKYWNRRPSISLSMID